jgi:hypothetical protein
LRYADREGFVSTALSERKKEAVATAARFEKPHRKRPP